MIDYILPVLRKYLRAQVVVGYYGRLKFIQDYPPGLDMQIEILTNKIYLN